MARGRTKTAPKRIDAVQRMAHALELRRHGHTFTEIADRAGYASPQAAHDAVKRGLFQTMKEPADALRQLESERLDELHLAWFPKAIAGEADAAAVVLKVMDRRARLLGLDAPTRTVVDASIMAAEKQGIESSLLAKAHALRESVE